MVAASINSCALLINIAVVVGKYYSSAPKHPKKTSLSSSYYRCPALQQNPMHV
ncbi:MAG: hypothetical protein IJ269_06340 [Bacteroidales bacterium]|nr:hypothetical protein [Bacteroidales bacterium]